MNEDADFAVIGGGLVGVAIGWGLARLGQRVTILDEGDLAFRASRGNFALVWVQSKGLGMPRYARWTRLSSDSWGGLAETLRADTGIDLHFNRPGGFNLALSEDELEKKATQLKRLHNQPDMAGLDYEVVDRARLKAMLPEIGPDVVGGIYCPFDGHTNALKLLRALHTAFAALGGTYMPESRVARVTRDGGAFCIAHQGGTLTAGRVVLAAGSATRRWRRWSASRRRCARSAARSS
jgi:glycine/D-amino acid oxidase-like deaminating enzyme